MRRIFLAALACAFVASCANRYDWVKPGMTAKSKESDVAGCSGKTSHMTKDDPDAIATVDRCMAERGYQKKLIE